MSKPAQVVIGETANEKLKEPQFDGDQLYLKKKKEDEIRIKLDEFAKELSQVKKQRDEYQAPFDVIKSDQIYCSLPRYFPHNQPSLTFYFYAPRAKSRKAMGDRV